MRYSCITVLFFFILLPAYAGLQLPAVFSDGMILQRRQPIVVRGSADAGRKVWIELNNHRVETQAGEAGQWKAVLPSMEAGGPYRMIISEDGHDSVVLSDILIGEVWICAGQSNMNFILAADRNGQQALHDSNAAIREFRCAMPPGVENPENDPQQSRWVSNAGDKANFSAVAYYFAAELQRTLHVPVGIVVMACGGTRAEAWTAPGLFYTQVVQPVAGFGARGLLWYQGESNTLPDNSGRSISERAGEYKLLLKNLISSFRTAWKDMGWPVYLVQLPAYKDPSGDIQWARIRQAQLEISRELLNISLTVTIDAGDCSNLHPDNKRPVGIRLARQALRAEYGQRFPDEVSSPTARKWVVRGSKVVLYFTHTGKGLVSAGGAGQLTGFEVAGAALPDHFFPATARIKGNTVVVGAREVRDPVAVRYAWSDCPPFSLFNREGLPASPFINHLK